MDNLPNILQQIFFRSPTNLFDEFILLYIFYINLNILINLNIINFKIKNFKNFHKVIILQVSHLYKILQENLLKFLINRMIIKIIKNKMTKNNQKNNVF